MFEDIADIQGLTFDDILELSEELLIPADELLRMQGTYETQMYKEV